MKKPQFRLGRAAAFPDMIPPLAIQVRMSKLGRSGGSACILSITMLCVHCQRNRRFRARNAICHEEDARRCRDNRIRNLKAGY
jgi:hypothetical protein